MDTLQHPDAVTHTTEIVAGYVTHNSLPAADLPALIGAVHLALASLGKPETATAVKCEPAVAIRGAIRAESIACLCCGKRFRSLKRHLTAEHEINPAEYRARFGLDADYPMIAPDYAAVRSNLAKTIGLGRKAVANGMPA